MNKEIILDLVHEIREHRRSGASYLEQGMNREASHWNTAANAIEETLVTVFMKHFPGFDEFTFRRFCKNPVSLEAYSFSWLP
jgi:hypothetical protein